MKIILTNDDGFDHSGIKSLYRALHRDHQVFLIGPDQNRSGYSSAITFLTPLKHKKYADNIFSINGTPLDCVKVAMNLLCPFKPDIVISGINPGPNLGSDILLSGTVGAALEGRSLKFPSIAVSSAAFEKQDFSFEAEFIKFLVTKIDKLELNNFEILNINIPDQKEFPEPDIKITNTYINEKEFEAHSELSDRTCLAEGHISISPIRIDTISAAGKKKVDHWLKENFK